MDTGETALSGEQVDFETYMRELGLSDKGGLADQFRYKGTPETITSIDAAGRLKVFHCDTRRANDWEGFYAALWKYGIEAAADACSVSRKP